MVRVLVAAVLAVPLGVALGGTAQLVDRAHPGLAWLGALGVPWLVVAFAAGALARDRLAAATAGAVALVAGTGTWYALYATGPSTLSVPVMAIAWAPAATLAGAAFGTVGAEWRRRRGEGLAGAAAAAALSGALIGEAFLLAPEWPGRAAHAILAAELAAGLVLPLALVRRRVLVPALGLTLVAAVVMGAAEAEVRDALRQVGWRGR